LVHCCSDEVGNRSEKSGHSEVHFLGFQISPPLVEKENKEKEMEERRRKKKERRKRAREERRRTVTRTRRKENKN